MAAPTGTIGGMAALGGMAAMGSMAGGPLTAAGPVGAVAGGAIWALMWKAGGRGCCSGTMLCFLPSAASLRSASSPWRSPLPSFLYAYSTVMALLSRYWPFMVAWA